MSQYGCGAGRGDRLNGADGDRPGRQGLARRGPPRRPRRVRDPRGSRAGPGAAGRGDRRRGRRLRLPAAEAGDEPGAARRAARRAPAHGSRDDRQPFLRLVAAVDPDGLPRDQGGRGRGVRRCGRRVDLSGRRLPEVGGRAPPSALRRRRADRKRVHPDGAHRRERRGALGRLPRRHGSLRAAVAGARGGGAGLGVLRTRDLGL